MGKMTLSQNFNQIHFKALIVLPPFFASLLVSPSQKYQSTQEKKLMLVRPRLESTVEIDTLSLCFLLVANFQDMLDDFRD